MYYKYTGKILLNFINFNNGFNKRSILTFWKPDKDTNADEVTNTNADEVTNADANVDEDANANANVDEDANAK
jgi:hypothetical protein